MSFDTLVVRGAREHNLKNISVELPRDQLIVLTGLSGSGKSSLAFDTIYAEGQRRYVESLSSYARQFLGQMDKPDVDFIEGLSPAISIDQKSASRNPRSTVGHHHRGLRLPPPAVRPHRRAPLPRARRAAGAPDAPADRRPPGRAPRRHPLPGAGSGGAGPQGRVRHLARRPAGRGLRPGPDRRRDPGHRRVPQGRRPAGPLRAAHDRDRGRPAGEARGHRAPPHRLGRDGAEAGRGRGRDRAGAARGRGRRPRRSRSASTSPAPSASSRTRSWRRATSRSTRRTAPARRATASAPASRSTPSWSCPTPTCRSARAPSPRGARPAPSTSPACSKPWPRPTRSTSTSRGRSSPRPSRTRCCSAPRVR